MFSQPRKSSNRSAESGKIVIVSGLPRSGTSMMMKMLEAGGLKIMTDNLRTADESNPKGYYEFERVKKLKEGDYDWLADAPGKVVKVISALLEYLPNRYEYKIIFMVRNMEEVLSSQRQMLTRDGKDADDKYDAKLSDLYGEHMRKTEAWLEQQANMSTIKVNYNQTLGDPEPVVNQINAFLGGKLNIKAMLQVVDPQLYRERKSS